MRKRKEGKISMTPKFNIIGKTWYPKVLLEYVLKLAQLVEKT